MNKNTSVSILLAVVYASGDFGSSPAVLNYSPTFLHEESDVLRPVQHMTYHIYAYFLLNHLYYLYIVFFPSKANVCPENCWLVWLSTWFFQLIVHDWILSVHCLNAGFFIVSGYKPFSSQYNDSCESAKTGRWIVYRTHIPTKYLSRDND